MQKAFSGCYNTKLIGYIKWFHLGLGDPRMHLPEHRFKEKLNPVVKFTSHAIFSLVFSDVLNDLLISLLAIHMYFSENFPKFT